MAAEINFSANDVRSFKESTQTLKDLMESSYEALRVRTEMEQARLEGIIRQIEEIIRQMLEEIDYANRIKAADEEVLAAMNELLNELREQARILQEEYNKAYEEYRKAAAEETRLHNTTAHSPEEAQIISSQLEAARRRVRATSERCSEIKMEQERLSNRIEKLKANIRDAEAKINHLEHIIHNIYEKKQEAEQHCKRLQKAIDAAAHALSAFFSRHFNCCSELTNCGFTADEACDCAQRICAHLDWDNELKDHDSRKICFYDLNALSDMSTSLFETCQSYNDDTDDLYASMERRKEEMQDNLIFSSVDAANAVQSDLAEIMRMFHHAAQECRNADHVLHEYIRLGDKY